MWSCSLTGLSGFITRLGDRESDEGTPLTFFFATSRLSGQRLAFTTRQVHGVWFSFEGTIVRGSARSRDQQGYYLLQGRLVMHDVASQTAAGAHGVVASGPAISQRLAFRSFLENLRRRSINTMRRDYFPFNSPQEEFLWIAQQAQCGTAA